MCINLLSRREGWKSARRCDGDPGRGEAEAAATTGCGYLVDGLDL